MHQVHPVSFTLWELFLDSSDGLRDPCGLESPRTEESENSRSRRANYKLLRRHGAVHASAGIRILHAVSPSETRAAQRARAPVKGFADILLGQGRSGIYRHGHINNCDARRTVSVGLYRYR